MPNSPAPGSKRVTVYMTELTRLHLDLIQAKRGFESRSATIAWLAEREVKRIEVAAARRKGRG